MDASKTYVSTCLIRLSLHGRYHTEAVVTLLWREMLKPRQSASALSQQRWNAWESHEIWIWISLTTKSETRSLLHSLQVDNKSSVWLRTKQIDLCEECTALNQRAYLGWWLHRLYSSQLDASFDQRNVLERGSVSIHECTVLWLPINASICNVRAYSVCYDEAKLTWRLKSEMSTMCLQWALSYIGHTFCKHYV